MSIIEQLQYDLQTADQLVRLLHHPAVIRSQIRLTFRTVCSMGANIKVEGNTAIIDGVSRYTGANIYAPDLRAGAALVLAAMSAEGFSTVDDIRYIERGYEDFHLKLQGLGAQIELIETERDLRKFKLKIG